MYLAVPVVRDQSTSSLHEITQFTLFDKRGVLYYHSDTWAVSWRKEGEVKNCLAARIPLTSHLKSKAVIEQSMP